MLDNDSPLLKSLLSGDLCHLLTTSHLKRLLSLISKDSGSNASKHLETLLSSQAFKGLYY